MSETPNPPQPRHPGIYLLPNLFTTAAMLAGYFAIISAFSGRYTQGAVAVFIAALLDGIDGRVARMTNTQRRARISVWKESSCPAHWCRRTPC